MDQSSHCRVGGNDSAGREQCEGDIVTYTPKGKGTKHLIPSLSRENNKAAKLTGLA